MRIVTDLVIKAQTVEVLETLNTNKDKHRTIVQEAREGYLTAAMKELTQRMAELKSGKLVELHFSLRAPQDYTKVYEVAIKMLQMHTGDTILLKGDQVRHLIMDDWDWMETFLVQNRRFSDSAKVYATEKGFGE